MPTGTVLEPIAIVTPGFVSSASDATFAPEAGTASTSRLAANTCGFSTRPSLYSASGSVVFAEANTSGLTPWRICAASSSDPANDARTVASSKSAAYALIAVFSEVAAETVSVGLVPELPPQAASRRQTSRRRRMPPSVPMQRLGDDGDRVLLRAPRTRDRERRHRRKRGGNRRSEERVGVRGLGRDVGA